MNGVVILAPADARWSMRAECVLTDARMFVARLYEPGLLALLLRSGGVRAVAIDTRIARKAPAALRDTLGWEPVGVILVHEGDEPLTLGTWHSRPWPDDAAAALALVATR